MYEVMRVWDEDHRADRRASRFRDGIAELTEVGRVALVERVDPNATLVANDAEALIRGLKVRLVGVD